jgi:glycosyltransferase involved in cell wall biosynthesis
MKIFIIITSLQAGGAERVVSTLANYWSGIGWDVTIVTLTGQGHDHYNLDSRIKRFRLNLGRPRAVLVDGLLGTLTRLYEFRRFLVNDRPDIALAFMPISNIVTGLACLGTGIITIGSERNYPPLAPLKWYWKLLCRLVYPQLTAVTALTQRTADWLQFHIKPRHIAVIPNLVHWPLPESNPVLVPEKILAPLNGQYLLLAVGRLENQKGYDRLLHAFAELHENYPDWCLVILGEGGLRKSLESKCDRLGLQDCVALPGVAGNISSWYTVADAFVMTSLYEGIPNALLESLAHGLPAVAVDCDTGPSDILRHEIDGILVPQDDHEALVVALDRMMGNEKLRKRFAERAVEVRNRFSMRRITDLWEALFKQLLESRQG